MIIAIDERSKTSPIEILDRYRDRIDFELWNDTHYFRHKPDKDLQSINLARQQSFLAKCMQTLKSRPNTKWTMFTDTDEFIVINRRARHVGGSLYRDQIPNLDQPGSLLAFLEREQRTKGTVCISMGRLQFAPDESDASAVQNEIPLLFNASQFLTFRWLKAAADLVGPKNVVDLSAVGAGEIPADKTYQHRVLAEHCGGVGLTWHRRNSLLQVYHYMGTLEQFNFRDDARWSSQGKQIGRNGRYTRYKGQFAENADDLRLWIKGFVALVGEKEAVRLLAGVGQTKGWARASAHANRFADPKMIPSEWPPGGGTVLVEADEGGGSRALEDGEGDPSSTDDGEETNGDGTDDDDAVDKSEEEKEAADDDDTSGDNDDDHAEVADSDNESVKLPTNTFYSQARPDRSGAAIADMLLAHAYAFAHKLSYGGACGDAHDQYRDETLKLIQAVGLEDLLRFDCPAVEDASPIIDRQVYFAEKATLWSKEYLGMIHGKIQYPSAQHSVAVHVRRGDVTPCGKYANRYLPNSHYLHILQKYVPTGKSVAVFSESEAFESFDEFRDKGYAVFLDSDLSHVWRTIMTADYVVLSKSSFSFIPAMLNPTATIIYTPFLHPSLSDWKTVGQEILDETRERVSELQSTCVQR